MQHAIRLVVFVCCALASLHVAPVQAEKRVALVIGNSAYVHASALRNPANDAPAIAGHLKQVGFDEVALKLDLGFDGMRLALRDFGQTTRGADVAPSWEPRRGGYPQAFDCELPAGVGMWVVRSRVKSS